MGRMRLAMGLSLALLGLVGSCEDDSKYTTGGPTATTTAPGGAAGGGGAGGMSGPNSNPDASQD
jgi:hypothetical protein